MFRSGISEERVYAFEQKPRPCVRISSCEMYIFRKAWIYRAAKRARNYSVRFPQLLISFPSTKLVRSELSPFRTWRAQIQFTVLYLPNEVTFPLGRGRETELGDQFRGVGGEGGGLRENEPRMIYADERVGNAEDGENRSLRR